MDMNDLRAEALRRASDDCYQQVPGQSFMAEPEVVVTRAKAYLAFLLGDAPELKSTVKRKRVRS